MEFQGFQGGTISERVRHLLYGGRNQTGMNGRISGINVNKLQTKAVQSLHNLYLENIPVMIFLFFILLIQGQYIHQGQKE